MNQKHSLEQFPDFTAAAAQLKKFFEQLNAAKAREERMRTELGSRMYRAQSEVAMEAEALVAGDRKAMPDTPIATQKLQAEHAEVRHEIEVLKHAIKRQQQILEAERGKASAEICKRVAPEHRELVRKIAMGIRDLATAITAEQAFRDALESIGVSSGHLRQPSYPPLGDLTDQQSMAWNYLREMNRSGLIDREYVPGLGIS